MDNILFVFTLCLTIAFLLSELFYRLRYPRVIGQILAGVILGLPFIGGFMREPATVDFIGSLADIGVVFLMLLVGTEVNTMGLDAPSREAENDSVFVSYYTPPDDHLWNWSN